MKKKWTIPRIQAETFTPNEYISTCGDTAYGNYLFECNAGTKGWRYAIKDSNGNYATINGRYMDQRHFYYTPCGETHISPTNDLYLTGYHLDNRWTPNDENIAVIIWTDNGKDIHCTTNLDRESWKVNRS